MTEIRNDWAVFSGTLPPSVPSVEKPPAMTALQWHTAVAEYIAASGHWAPATLQRRELILRQFEVHLAGKPLTWPNFRDAFQLMGVNRSPGVINLHRKVLRGFERWAVAAGMSNTMFSHLTRPVKEPKIIRTPVTYEEWSALVGNAPKDFMKELLEGLWMTGLAMSDVCMLEWKQVDLKQMVITKNREKSGGLCVIPLIHGSAFHLQLEGRYKDRENTLGDYPSTNGRHFVNNTLAEHIISKKSSNIFRYLDKMCRDLGMRKITTHDFRATFCTAAMAVGDPITTCAITGHSSPDELQSYVTPSLAKVRKLVEDANRWARGER